MKKILLLLLFLLVSCFVARAFAENMSYPRPGYTNAPIMYMNGIDAVKLNQDYQNSLNNSKNQTDSTTNNSSSGQETSAKTLKKEYNKLLQKNLELEKRVKDLERKNKEFDYRLYNLEKSKKR